MSKPAESAGTAGAEARARGADTSVASVAEPRLRQPTRSIGQIMAILQTEFPEISISKIRFLESEGLVEPEPWSKYTSPDKGCDWVGHQGTYQKKA